MSSLNNCKNARPETHTCLTVYTASESMPSSVKSRYGKVVVIAHEPGHTPWQARDTAKQTVLRSYRKLFWGKTAACAMAIARADTEQWVRKYAAKISMVGATA